jgi:indolepyruvate ferredoxin oxidoreductase
VLLTGIQALVRLPIDQMRRDKARQLNTGTFISGYRGSPLGGYDMQLAKNAALLEAHQIKFIPAVNEELAATAVWGSQQVNLFEGATVDGVCGIWYGKAPGVDRSTDAFRHGNAAGSSALGGVLVVAGDDHGCKSSSYPGQSEFAFVDVQMPVLNPSSVQEVLDYGLFGIELSRFSGCWVALITLTENMDSAATVDIDPQRVQISYPSNIEVPQGGLNIRVPDTPLAQEERLWRYKRPAALAFCRKNKLNKVVLDNPNAKLGIVTAGKAHLDLLQAMDDLGIDESKARQIGISIFKVGMTYPLDMEAVQEFARGLDYLFVVEEKRSLMEVQLKEELYNVEIIDPHFPKIIGKLDSQDNPLLPVYGELSPAIVAKVLIRALPNSYSDAQIERYQKMMAEHETLAEKVHLQSKRTAFFCSGCPHNTSTKVPEGSRALAGIGCHYLVQNMNRETYTFTQMGGEGVSWVGQAAFTKTPHVFVNLGDGTYFHSGILAIRQAVAAQVNITYKILFNDAVAMTGGQPHDGQLQPDSLARQVLAEGVKRLSIVTDQPEKYRGQMAFPSGVEIFHRDKMDELQREFREISGVTCIVYDQTCATELRRKRKRGLLPDPSQRVFINELVCEGCGDCSVQSNCMAVEPKETLFGTKRQINQGSCNKDMSCVNGFCPSFVTVHGGSLRKPSSVGHDYIALASKLASPALPELAKPWCILVSGVGGTGVVTLGALMLMAAHIEGKAATSLDQTGLAQKGGAVYSHIRIAQKNSQLHAVRISDAAADALIACDAVGAVDEHSSLSKLGKLKTQAIVNTHVSPTADFVLGKDMPNEEQKIIDCIDQRSMQTAVLDAFKIVEAALGSTTTANIVMFGYAWQKGLVPFALESIFSAIELNAVAVEENKKAFSLGRLAADDIKTVYEQLGFNKNTLAVEADYSLDNLIQKHSEFLTDYQNSNYAKRYQNIVRRVMQKEAALNDDTDMALSQSVARNLFKVMAYKDEYEVARLYTNASFSKSLAAMFEGDYKLEFNLAPPLLCRPDKTTGLIKKMRFGGWMQSMFAILAKLKFLRASPLDLFSYTTERKIEQKLVDDYETTVTQLISNLNTENRHFAVEISNIAKEIRGYGYIKMANYDRIKPQWEAKLSSYLQGETAWKSPLTSDPVKIVETN